MKSLFLVGAIALGMIFSFGCFYAFSKGAPDFSVFYEAWHLVNIGRGAEIYQVSPDRFLYGPGFAWGLAPFSLLSRSHALILWCVGKILVLVWMANRISQCIYTSQFYGKLSSFKPLSALGLSIWGIVGVARPILIDFSYGQVNLFVLSACVWALAEHFSSMRGSSQKHLRAFLSWCVLTWVALSKLFPLPLLVVPWWVTRGVPQSRRRKEKLGILFGFLVVNLPPLLALGWHGYLDLLLHWRDALVAKGLPLESHNQSFIALLYHYWSGLPTQVISEGTTPLLLGWSSLTLQQIQFLSYFWTFSSLGVLLGWMSAGNHHSPILWSAVTLGLLIVPSHLIWKPYFVMGIPLMIVFVHQVYKKTNLISYLILLSLFVGINLSGFDFVGHKWAAYLEAGSILLLLHLMLLFSVVRKGAHHRPS